MLTVSYDDLLKGITSLWGGKAELPSADIYAAMRGALDLALQQAWESEWWPDLMRGEERKFRATYDGAVNYVAGDEVYEPYTDAYYQALYANVGWSPVILSGGQYVPEYTNWYPCQNSYNGDDYSATTAYDAGDVVYYPATQRFYAARGSTTGNLPTDTDYWGVLTPFDRYVPWSLTGATPIGEVFDVKTDNPLATTNYDGLDWGLSANGVQVRDLVTKCWIEFRARRPQLTGDVFDATASYAIGDQVWYTPANGQGNLYDCIDTATGELPTDTAHWSVVEIPRIFKGYLIWEAYAWLLKPEEQAQQRALATAMAEKYISLEADKLYRQSAQTAPPSIRTY